MTAQLVDQRRLLTTLVRRRLVMCWHRWTNWKTIAEYKPYVAADGYTLRWLIQKRICEKCHKVELNRQEA